MKADKTYIIRHKETKTIWKASSGKKSWKASGHAKGAWARSSHRHTKDIEKDLHFKYPKFDEQDVYELVELKPESEDLLKEAVTLLEECLVSLDPRSELKEYVLYFLKEKVCR